jgi:hypothetical protein
MTLNKFMQKRFLEWNYDTKNWKKTVEDEAKLNINSL